MTQERWTKEQIAEIYNSPVLDLMYRGATVHREYHKANEVQVCTLLSIKTGGCPEDCGYCNQSAHHQTGLKKEKLMDPQDVIHAALKAKEAGSTRFCMGAAWRNVRDNQEFDNVLKMVKHVSNMGLEVCSTLGMLTLDQAKKLKEAGLHAYNHNLDTSEDFYEKVTSTRKYQDRLDTIDNVAKANISLCCGGIIGLGETDTDRVDLLHTLANLDTPPESIPVNALVAVEGTPMEKQGKVSIWDMIRMIATARILVPTAMVRLSAGRNEMTLEEQAMCFLAGANSIFAGEKLLTTPNPEEDQDKKLFELLSLEPRVAHKKVQSTCNHSPKIETVATA